jgi:hypothetical protein
MTFATIASIIVAYAAVSVLLLSLNLTSLWRWWIKGGAIVATVFFFGFSYFAIASLLGWPTRATVPPNFSLLATRIIEPDKFTGAPGSIFLWLETLDDENVPSGQPLSYEVGYTQELADAVTKAQELLDAGEQVEGDLNEYGEERMEADSEQQAAGEPAVAGQLSQGGGSQYEPIGLNITFNDMPPVRLPGKGVL